MNENLMGRLVFCEGDRHGNSRIVDVTDEDKFVVEYFPSPTQQDCPTNTFPRSALQSPRIAANTRVYCQDLASGTWHAGRLAGGRPIPARALGTDFDGYRIVLPNGCPIDVPLDGLFVRWNEPVDDPIDYLAARVHETPFWHNNRCAFVRAVIAQRRLSGGLTGLMSSSVGLFRHQYDVLRRVLSDPVQRYLLADEVGLGKTIEAGVIIRQYVLDMPEHGDIAVLVPPHLADQWRRELTERLHLGDELDDRLQVLPADDRGLGVLGEGRFDMLVIDEVHQVAGWTLTDDDVDRKRWRIVARVARDTPRVFLLSATPVLNNERGFLAMLHLLDPSVYSLEDWEAFQLRIQHRQLIADAYQEIHKDSPNLFVEEQVELLLDQISQDEHLRELCARVHHITGEERDEDDPERVEAIGGLRLHISETYRLHRRLLRNRRHALDDPPQGRCGVHPLLVAGVPQIEELLEEWRDVVTMALYDTDDEAVVRAFCLLYTMLVEATFCHPSALRRVAQARLDRSAAGARDYAGAAVRVRALVETPMVPGEDDVLRRLVDSSEDTVAGDDRCEAIATWLSQEKHPAAVVFVDAPTVADAVCEELETLLARPVARYPYGLPAFEGGGTEVLVCDRGAEDGLNLQYSASCVVHYDLPLSAHRIEQRIGRLDRMLALRKVRSVALVPAVGLARLWFECLDTGVRIFDDSSASLQYVIEEHIQRFASELLSEGPDAFRRLRALWSAPEDGLDAQRKRIRAQELLDSLEDDPIRRQVYEDLEDREYDDGDNGRRSPLKRETEAMLTESFRLKRRGQGRSIVHYAYRDHVLSGLDFERWFGAALNDQVPQQTRPVTFSRAAAVDEHTELVRMGHPLVDGLWEFTRYDDRGISFAMLRIRPVIKLANIPPLAFRFDYYVETDLTAAWAVIEDHPGTAVEALRRRADEAFPPQYKTIWISSELERLTDELAIMHLETPYGDEGLHHVGHDINIHAEDWEVLDEVLGITDWSGLCHLARDTSRRHFEDHVDLPRTCRTRVDELRERHRTVSAQMESRIASASSVSASERETLALEQALFEALVAGIENPYIRLDAVGAVVTMRDNPLVAGGRQ